ncbi:metal ABC transporter substrate-binding protein [Jidongwangia harbinensis]|uniref:metal ABC transporter substrate-binding protein n=1 Tax=Jidongwangia harbinensis TaxID=2878561 RepID=UPI001CDA37DC|nr:metal ABC transporter substrate-binding protein [Jidongwangia harbinensis]MCA2216870.1 metal ABC transporter substrate-binding protein [Jidongwangia harbinensis]
MKLRLLAALLAVGVTAGCGSGADARATGEPDVVTAFYPLQFLTSRIGGDAVSVTDLTKPGVEPHDLELTPRQVGQISDADLVVYLKGFQPAVDSAVEQEAKDRAFDAGSAVDLLAAATGEHAHADEPAGEHEETAGGTDPHVWLDPVRFGTVAEKLGARLAEADPAHAADYTSRAAAVRADLGKLDAEYAAGLKTCARREIVTSHTSFQYLAARYRLEQIGISGISPEAEPAPQRLAEVASEAREHGTTTIFFETLVSPKVAETIAREVGARTAVLDPLEGLTEPGADYYSVMRSNLSALRQALGCTS